VVSKKTIEVLTSVISSIGSTNYFKTMSASNILMELILMGEGRNIFINIILKNKFTFSIFNHLTDENQNENILTALLQIRDYQLFQILFNQAILNYYSSYSDNLFPLMNAILWLEKKRVPSKYGFAYLNP
jgi:hypothetical protein